MTEPAVNYPPGYDPAKDPECEPTDKWWSDQAKRLAFIKSARSITVERIAPQAGKQAMFNGTPADIAWYGGAAGAGKSFMLLLEVIRHLYNPLFRGVIFRRTYKQIHQPGGLWDTASFLYGLTRCNMKLGAGVAEWASGASLNFSHMQLEKDKMNWDGAQLALSLWDELIHFTESQFEYVTFSRSRSLSGVKPYSRAGLNPDPDGWCRRWVDWWIDENGWPIQDRAGVIRAFYRDGDDLVWGADAEELLRKYKINPHRIKTFTYIPATLADNKILEDIDPAYRGNIESLPFVQRLRLQGNWNARANAGSYYKRHFFTPIEIPPQHIASVIRMWDFAATKPSEENKDPDYLVGGLYGITRAGDIVVLDIVRDRVGPGDVDQIILNTSKRDREVWGSRYTVGLEQEPASMPKILIDQYCRKLLGFRVWVHKPGGSKEQRAIDSAQHGQNIGFYMMRGHWNHAFVEESYAFPTGPHDDQVDTLTGAYEFLTKHRPRDLSGYA